MSGISRTPAPHNEPVYAYAPGSTERETLKAELERTARETVEIPLYVDGQKIRTAQTDPVVMPHEHGHRLANACRADDAHVHQAIAATKKARREWGALPWDARAAVFLKAADLLAGPWRARMNAATMLGQSKTAYQAEIDSAAELCDFWRFNVHYYRELIEQQPISSPGMWNRTELRPLDGFVLALTPFNFTAIAGNLPTAPALVGNTVLWKPAPTQLRAAYTIMELLEVAGLPPGVINMVHGVPQVIGEIALASPELAGVHFTGSTQTFQTIWKSVGNRIESYAQYPRLVGETGGKNFVLAHPSADVEALACAIVRGAFEYQGQKCSAASRLYIPRSLWPALKTRLIDEIKTIKVGDVRDFSNFMGAVIDARAFQKIKGYVELAKAGPDTTVIAGGGASDQVGYFIEPTLVETKDPEHRLMKEEIFGPVTTAFIYEDQAFEETLALCERTASYALTGAIFATDRRVIEHCAEALRFAAGNFYINDKPTGAVVGQQPFGGGRASGTNDKAGSAANVSRWVSTRAIKETFVPATDYRYPFMR